jgi:hypothetical protein
MVPDPFLLMSLPATTTGLPFVVWIAVDPGDGRGRRVYVSHVAQPALDDLIEVTVEPDVHVIGDRVLDQANLDLLVHWIEVNRVVIARHWSGEIDSMTVIEGIKSVS